MFISEAFEWGSGDVRSVVELRVGEWSTKVQVQGVWGACTDREGGGWRRPGGLGEETTECDVWGGGGWRG